MKKKSWWITGGVVLLIIGLIVVPRLRDKMAGATDSTLENINASFMDSSIADGVATSKSADQFKGVEESNSSNDMMEARTDVATKPSPFSSNKEVQKRMVIQTAVMDIEVKNYEQAQTQLEKTLKRYNGYIVESNKNGSSEESLSGRMIIRLPQEHFQAFLSNVEGVSKKVNQRTVKGTDVTEEYVDIESRLKSKRVLEQRLIDFLNKSQTVENSLRISSELSNVQSDIESMLGRMKYLKDQTSLSTVELSISEEKVIIPELNVKKEELNTGEKIEREFKTSINALVLFGSGLAVLLLGKSPIIVVYLVIGTLVYVAFRLLKKKQNQKISSSTKESEDDSSTEKEEHK